MKRGNHEQGTMDKVDVAASIIGEIINKENIKIELTEKSIEELNIDVILNRLDDIINEFKKHDIKDENEIHALLLICLNQLILRNLHKYKENKEKIANIVNKIRQKLKIDSDEVWENVRRILEFAEFLTEDDKQRILKNIDYMRSILYESESILRKGNLYFGLIQIDNKFKEIIDINPKTKKEEKKEFKIGIIINSLINSDVDAYTASMLIDSAINRLEEIKSKDNLIKTQNVFDTIRHLLLRRFLISNAIKFELVSTAMLHMREKDKVIELGPGEKYKLLRNLVKDVYRQQFCWEPSRKEEEFLVKFILNKVLLVYFATVDVKSENRLIYIIDYDFLCFTLKNYLTFLYNYYDTVKCLEILKTLRVNLINIISEEVFENYYEVTLILFRILIWAYNTVRRIDNLIPIPEPYIYPPSTLETGPLTDKVELNELRRFTESYEKLFKYFKNLENKDWKQIKEFILENEKDLLSCIDNLIEVLEKCMPGQERTR